MVAKKDPAGTKNGTGDRVRLESVNGSQYLEAVCLSHWEGEYSDYSEDPDCYQSQH